MRSTLAWAGILVPSADGSQRRSRNVGGNHLPQDGTKRSYLTTATIAGMDHELPALLVRAGIATPAQAEQLKRDIAALEGDMPGDPYWPDLESELPPVPEPGD